MRSPDQSPSSKHLWAGRIISGLMVAFLVMDGVTHLMKIAPVVQAFDRLGFPISLAVALGVLELVCTVIYIYPATSALGAILLTGYLGGAVAMHLRVGSSLFGEMLLPVYIGVLLWVGLYLRGVRLAGSPALPASKKTLWTGRVISALPALLILFASIPKVLKAAPMIEGLSQYGFPEQTVVVVGVIELACTVIYLVPRTRILGAILMAGLMGGATATNVRVSNPSWIVTVILGVLVWLGLYLRGVRLRALIPVANSNRKEDQSYAENNPVPVV
ncbi:MAG TPA: DoxX family protein [Bryobacteraceae bacterium]|jgi:hypothetical protein|nr:DoxX family protein [Bryobacteraceae bacterium]